MFFRQVLHEDLGCASYVIADGGEAAVVDPKWDVAPYLELAEEHGFRIAHVLETHNHADHVSGRGRLAEATGAAIWIAPTEVGFEHRTLGDGDAIELGDVRIRALATPGHRPEHTSYLVEDRSRGERPWLVLTGDSLFVGDVARPDLAVEAEEGARGLHRSLARLAELPDYAEVWPGHIGGSLCGGAGMSEKPGSTIGFERRFNPAFAPGTPEDEFVARLTGRLAPQPPNFRRIVDLNRGPLIRHAPPVDPLVPERVRALVEAGATLVDGRATRAFDAEHVPRSLNVTMVKAAVGTRAAWVVDPDSDVVVVAATDAESARLAGLLHAVGFRSLLGYLAGGIPAWRDAGLPVGTTEAIDAAALARGLAAGELTLLDVREDDEWEAGHVEGSLHVPYHELAGGPPAELELGERPVAVACSAGNRSSIAVSLLKRAGVDAALVHVADGGVPDVERHGVTLVRA